MDPFTPPPATYPSYSTGFSSRTRSSLQSGSSQCSLPTSTGSPEMLHLPPPMNMPDLDLPDPSLPYDIFANGKRDGPVKSEKHVWTAGMSSEKRDGRERWLAGGRGRMGLRIVIVTENFLPKVDGVTRTLARLLEHLRLEGHECMLLGPGSGMDSYAGHPLVGTAGVPLVVYPGLKLNFLRPKFLRAIKDFQPDVVHVVDPIWLGAQTLMAMELGWAGEKWVGEDGPALGAGITGAVVASYHTNLATYATLFGMSWLEPIIWRFQSWLYSKTLLTLCPSPSTRNMLRGQSWDQVRLWPRGVDLLHFSPSKRCLATRASWGVGDAPRQNLANEAKPLPLGEHHTGRKVSMPLTPPATPLVLPIDGTAPSAQPIGLPERAVMLYVGRISWEKNLQLLLQAYSHLPTPRPKLVFVGDGPARVELESTCDSKGYDATFMGHRSGEELARCYASADVFAFPSFTETFGQVVLEAMASGLPVVGLDAEGTRDLVSHTYSGLLLPLSSPCTNWANTLKSPDSPAFASASRSYAGLLRQAAGDHHGRIEMGRIAASEGVRGYTWWDAMESCVDGYRESMRIARDKRKARTLATPRKHELDHDASSPRRISRINRVVSRRLAKRDDTADNLWHLKTVLKIAVAIYLFWAIYSHHHATQLSNLGESVTLTT